MSTVYVAIAVNCVVSPVLTDVLPLIVSDVTVGLGAINVSLSHAATSMSALMTSATRMVLVAMTRLLPPRCAPGRMEPIDGALNCSYIATHSTHETSAVPLTLRRSMVR
jgi:hypothetical protein